MKTQLQKSEEWISLSSKEKAILIFGLILCLSNIVGVFYFLFYAQLIPMAVCVAFSAMGLKLAMNVHNDRVRRILTIGTAGAGKQISLIRDNIDRISYLINYDLKANYHLISEEGQFKLDRFFNVHHPHEVKNLYLQWIEKYCNKNNVNPFNTNQYYEVTEIWDIKFKEEILSNIQNFN